MVLKGVNKNSCHLQQIKKKQKNICHNKKKQQKKNKTTLDIKSPNIYI